VHLKCAYDLSIGEERDDEAIYLVVDVADATKHELERELTNATMTVVDDPHSVLGVALTLLGEGIEGERVGRLIGIARRGMITINNANERRAA
jgi:hypothetical protein